MRPLRLEVSGFTAFRTTQVIEFSDNLFVIAGPTGAGKSSLLDAICFALYGEAARPGVRPRDLISLGAPSLKVCMDFSVGAEKYRVTRSALRKVSGEALLENLDSDKPLAANINQVNAEIARIVGFEHDVFTRSVLLPQGQFARFLSGTPTEKQKVLGDLIGLEVYGRMSVLAGNKASYCLGQVQASEQRASSITWTDEDATGLEAKAVEADRSAAAGEALLDPVRERVVEWTDLNRLAAKLGGDADELQRLAAGLVDEINGLAAVQDQIARASAARDEARAALETASVSAIKARDDLEGAEPELGGQAQMQAALHAISAREALDSEIEKARGEIAELDRSTTAEDEQARTLAAALEAAEAESQSVLKLYQAAAITAGMVVGDPCPVCGMQLDAVPEAHGREEVERARSVVQEARTNSSAAEKSLAAGRGNLEARRSALGEKEAQAVQLAAALAESHPGLALADLKSRLEGGLKKLEGLTVAARKAQRQRELADQQYKQADDAWSALEEQRARARESMVALTTLANQHATPEGTPDQSPPDDLSPWAAEWRRWTEQRAGAVGAQVVEASSRAERVAADLRQLVADWVSPDEATDRVELRLNQRVSEKRAEAMRVKADAARLREEIAERERLRQEMQGMKERGEVYETLRSEMLPGRFPKFVLAQALEALCLHASERLWSITGRYRMKADNAEFFVIDTWAADEERSVKTLSGGETFLASLALSLALSEELLSISADQKIRLESLFIDEGFGSLDRDSLDGAINALEVLQSQGDRMIGLISHVGELAERLPHIDVVKSQEGSYVGVQSGLGELPPPVVMAAAEPKAKPRPRQEPEKAEATPRLFE
ncbi:MAG: AAA family ATPase [Dehalococcoidia bacterium]|nr:AAA family ATPase [Dehalococcoidia bacterium]